MRKLRQMLCCVLLTVSIVTPACAGDDTLIGTGVGAALGGLFGSQFGHGAGQVAATGLGITMGGLIGTDIGHAMDRDNAQSYAAQPPIIYSEPPPIAFDAYSPTYVAPPAPPPIYVDQGSGTYCRPFSQRVRINGRMQEAYGTACLQPDGSWRIVP